MENTSIISQEEIGKLVSETYEHDKDTVLYYVYKHIGNYEDAQDITQDVFLRMMEYGKMLRSDTVRSFMFTVARNLVTDYMRRQISKQEVGVYSMEGLDMTYDDVECKVFAKEISKLEIMKANSLPEQRRVIYMKSRFECLSTEEIAAEMSLSKRTVEGHLLMGRKQVREFIKQCI